MGSRAGEHKVVCPTVEQCVAMKRTGTAADSTDESY